MLLPFVMQAGQENEAAIVACIAPKVLLPVLAKNQTAIAAPSGWASRLSRFTIGKILGGTTFL